MMVSVVIPVLNEKHSLPRLILALRRCTALAGQSGNAVQMIVSDGGSSDGTREWCEFQADILLVDSPRGKGPQLNAGAAAASGDLLLFLHADCTISPEAWAMMIGALADTRVAGGAFRIAFAEEKPKSLRLVEKGINFRTVMTRTATGDQGIFVRRKVFQSIGGAPDWPLFEDVELVKRIRSAGSFAVVRQPLSISGRRYIEHGVIRTAFLIYLLRLGYWLGVPPQRLKRWFTDMRPR